MNTTAMRTAADPLIAASAAFNGADAPFALAARITSYNVCYTKLLRNVLSYLPLVLIVVRLPDDAAANAAAKAKGASAPLKAALAAMRGSAAVRMAVVFTALLELLAWPFV